MKKRITVFLICITWIIVTSFIVQFSQLSSQQIKIQETSITNTTTDIELNQKFCGSSKCKFLFVYHVREQESKAQIHFRQFIQIAQKLDRVLVLTNVGKSAIGACLKYPFDYYYSTKSLQKNYPDLKFITQKQFSEWTRSRKKIPSSHQIMIQEDRKREFHELVENQSYIFKLRRQLLCINKFEVDFDNIKFYNLTMGGRYWGKVQSLKTLSNFIIDSLKKFDDTEVLLMKQKFYYQLFPYNTSALEYAPHIINKAFEISKNLQPFVGAQWRMELGNPLNMPKCSEKLISQLERLKIIHNTKNFYLATDYPLYHSLSQSSTFHGIEQEYHGRAIDILRDKVGFFSWLNFTLTDQFGNSMNVNEFVRSGIPGILDKIVCSRAKIFLIAPPECRKKTSSYTSMITSERLALIKDEVEGIENVSLEW